MSSVFKIDKAKVRQSFGSASSTYDGVAKLQRSVGLRLLQKTEAIAPTTTILDLGCGTGFIGSELLKRENFKHLFAIDIALPMVLRAREKLHCYSNISYTCADAERMPLQADSIDIIVSNLALQWCRDLPAVFTGFNAALKPEGALLFTTFGERTLCELKQAWASVDTFRHVNDFYNKFEIERFLLDTGFKLIEIETIIYHSRYPTAIELMQELKGIGARNLSAEAKKHVTTRTELELLLAAYPQNPDGSGITATFEVILVKAEG